jgi:crossover junction endodeoxyribonuclease RuvC
MMVLGIDPGLDGAVAFLSHNRMPDVFDLPTQAIEGGGSIRRRIDARGLRKLIRDHCPATEPVMVVIESLSAGQRPGSDRTSSAQSVGSQYRTRGALEATLELLGLFPREVHAMTWKRWYGIGKDKKDSLQVARELYPSLMDALRTKSTHNRGEALLIARWALQNLT